MRSRTRTGLMLPLCILLLGAASPEPVEPEAVLQDLLAAMRAGDRDSLEGFLDKRFAGEDALDTMLLMADVLGRDFRYHGVIERSPDRIVGLVADPAGERWTGVLLEFRGAPGELTGMGLRRADAPSSRSVSVAERDALVREAADWVRRGYVLPDLGPRMADALVGLLESGSYEDLGSPEALAIRLTDDLRDVYPDLHLTVLAPAAFERRQELLSGPTESAGPAPAPEARHRWYEHGGIEDLWWREGGRSAAVVRFSRLVEGPETTEAIRRALGEMARQDGLVFDLRGVPGHDGSVVQEIVSHFVDERRQMSRMEVVDPHTGTRSVRAEWVEPGALSGRMRGKPTFVLVDGGTASAAEALAGLLRSLAGATVVGETTAGAGHITTTLPLAAGFGLQLPIGRGLGEGSVEGKGLQPDIIVPPEEALDVALTRLGAT